MTNSALMKEQFQRNWPIMILSLLAYTLFIILPVLVQSNGDNTPERAQGMIDLLAMRNPVMLGATILVPFTVAMLMFSYLFNPKATAAYFSFTDSKSQLFWTNALTGLILIIVPLILMSLLLLIRVRFPVPLPLGDYALEYPDALFSRRIAADGVINTFPVIMGFLLRITVSFLFFYALWLLAFSLSGKWVISFLIFGILQLAPILIRRLGILIASTYVFGFYPVDVIEPEVLLSYTNPLAWYHGWGRIAQPLFFLIYISIALILFGLASTCMIGRRMEKAEDTIVFSGFKNVLVFALSIIGMIAMGRFILGLLTGRWFLYYGFVLGFAITFCVLQMVIERKFNVVSKIKWILPSAGIVGALYGIMLLITMFGMRGFTLDIPNYNQIAGVHISEDGFMELGDSFTNDSEVIRNVLAIHDRIIDTFDFRSDLSSSERDALTSQQRTDHRIDRRDNRRALHTTFWHSISGGGTQFRDNGGQHLYITYQLHNNDTIYRRYSLSEEFILRSEIDVLLDS